MLTSPETAVSLKEPSELATTGQLEARKHVFNLAKGAITNADEP
jgi:hypothetical protein